MLHFKDFCKDGLISSKGEECTRINETKRRVYINKSIIIIVQ